jgi:Transposase DDE domain/Transposase domain (DUF772)
MDKIAEWWANVQRSLLPYLEECLPPGVTPLHRQFILVLDLVRIEEQLPPPSWHWRGRRRHDRRALARAFLAKAHFNFPTTEALWDRLQVDETLRQLCGWEMRRQVPSLSTFSRAFAEFAESELLDRLHAARVKEVLEDTVVWHVSRDSTPIEAREKPAKREETAAPPKRPRGRPKKGEVWPEPEKKRLERQYWDWSTKEALAELPKECAVSGKKNARGEMEWWVGYKFHVDVGDTGLPLFAVTTSASLHDSQVAIPMARTTAERVTSWYDLMDAAYQSDYIYQVCLDLGHVPIIDHNPTRSQKKIPFEPDRARRFRHRTQSERLNAALKDDHGGRHVRVRGHRKVHAHLMFGLLTIFAEVVLGWVT